ncbi:hypothetical protein JZM24_13195 [Candidatus Sodalis endolongispinus]|uniref:Carbohydrate kinase PfkB domain-containing protein n=1 Tax=Candidatus Sodalis endolongispinus TaxID=2812662 RepID=A0ABS5YCU9_9GAMM|nr:hypothetical protein [Candidatus Sodalis endolongispinus]
MDRKIALLAGFPTGNVVPGLWSVGRPGFSHRLSARTGCSCSVFFAAGKLPGFCQAGRPGRRGETGAGYGTRSARLLATLQRQGYLTSLDLVSRQGDPHYRDRVLPALCWLDYLIINELEAGEFTGLALRDGQGRLVNAVVAEAAGQLQRLGVRRRVVIHAPEGAWGQEPGQPGLWLPSWRLSAQQIVGSVGAGDAFCAGVLYASHQRWPLAETLQLGHTCANFCLRAANAIEGIRPLAVMQAEMARGASGDTACEERRAGPGDVGCENIA